MKKLLLFIIFCSLSSKGMSEWTNSDKLRCVKFSPSHLAVCLPTETVIEKTIYDLQNDFEVRYNVLYKSKSFNINIESRHSIGLCDMLHPVYETDDLINIDDKTQLIKWKCGENICAYAFFSSDSPVSNNYNTTISYSMSDEDQCIGDEFMKALYIDNNVNEVQKPDIVNNLPLKINIEFKAGSTVIENESYAQIADFAEFVNENNAKIIIDGHTDKYEVQGGYTIDDERSFNLSKIRAENVQYLLVSKYGVEPNNIKKVISSGHLRPIAPNDNESDRQKNRRVQVYIE